MSENIECKDCKNNNYPVCLSTTIDGIKVNIEKLNEQFKCGIKNSNLTIDYKSDGNIDIVDISG